MDEQTFWFEQTLAALEAGQTLEQALAAVPPTMRDEVRAAVEAALWMQNTAAPTLHRLAQSWTPPPPPAVPVAEPSAAPGAPWLARLTGRTARLGWAWVAAIALTLLMLTSGTAYAAARALPGEWAYPLKRAAEEWHWRRADDRQRLDLSLDWGDRRLSEALRAQADARPQAVEQALTLYADHLARGTEVWGRLQRQGQVTPALRHTVATRLKAQETRLDALAAAGWGARPSWRTARAAQRAFAQAVALEPTNRDHGPAILVQATASPTPTPTGRSTPPATTTPTPALPPGASRDDGHAALPSPTPTQAPTDDECVSRGLGDAQNQCVPADQGAGNDTNDNPAGSGSAPPGQGPSDAPPGQGNGPPDNLPGQGKGRP